MRLLTGPLGESRIAALNSLPSSMKELSPGRTMPHLLAIERAVLTLSPVTIRTVIPARRHFIIASGTYRPQTEPNWTDHFSWLAWAKETFNSSCYRVVPAWAHDKLTAARSNTAICCSRQQTTGVGLLYSRSAASRHNTAPISHTKLSLRGSKSITHFPSC